MIQIVAVVDMMWELLTAICLFYNIDIDLILVLFYSVTKNMKKSYPMVSSHKIKLFSLLPLEIFGTIQILNSDSVFNRTPRTSNRSSVLLVLLFIFIESNHVE